MGRTFSKIESDDDFIIAPEGSAAAVLAGLAYLGKHESTWQGQTRKRELVGLSWELSERGPDGRGIAVTEVLTASTHEKAKFYARVVALSGGREPPEGADLEKLLGRGAIVTVVHELHDGKTWANVGNVGPLPRGMAAPVPTVAPVYYDIAAHVGAAYDRLPGRFRKLVDTAEPVPQPPPPAAPPTPGRQEAASQAFEAPAGPVGNNIPW